MLLYDFQSPAMSSLEDSLKDIILKRKTGDGEFCYVYQPSGETITGKKAAFRVLKSDEALYESLILDCKDDKESDEEFDSRVLKVLGNVPFEGESPVKQKPSTPAKTTPRKPLASSTPATSSTPKTILKDKSLKQDLMAKTSISKLIARRRLEGGEFSYVYIPLEKVINGKKAMYQFLKNQHEEFIKLKNSCKAADESDEAFDNRMMKEMLTVPYEKDVIVSAMDTDSGVELPTSKRKSLLDLEDQSKKPKLDNNANKGNVKFVYFELEYLVTHKPKKGLKHTLHMTQLGAINEANKKFFKPVIDKQMNASSESVLEKINMEKQGRMNFVFKKNNKTIACSNQEAGLKELISYCEELRKTAKKVCLVTYRHDSLKTLGFWVDKVTARNAFRKAVDQVVVLEQIFEQKPLKQYLPLTSITELFKKTVGQQYNMKNPTADDLAWVLMRCCNTLTKKHNFSLMDFSREIGDNEGWKAMTKTFGGREHLVSDVEENTFSVINSISFVKNEMFHDTAGPSTSRVASQAPKNNQNKTVATVDDPDIIEMDVDEDNFEYMTVGQEILYQVLCQPVLVKLGTMDENTKFIKFSLSKQMMKRAKANKFELLNQSAKVFWRNDTPYAFCNLCPEMDNDVRYKHVKAKIADTLYSDLSLGTYKSLNRTDEDQRYLSTKVLVDILVTKAETDNNKVRF